jgi:hypothetical protein
MNLGCGLGRVLQGRTLNRSYGLLTEIMKVVGTPKMVFTNLIMTTHMNKITNRPSMNSIATKGYINTYVEILKGGY